MLHKEPIFPCGFCGTKINRHTIKCRQQSDVVVKHRIYFRGDDDVRWLKRKAYREELERVRYETAILNLNGIENWKEGSAQAFDEIQVGNFVRISKRNRRRKKR